MCVLSGATDNVKKKKISLKFIDGKMQHQSLALTGYEHFVSCVVSKHIQRCAFILIQMFHS